MNKEIKEIISRVLDGESSYEDEIFLTGWLEKNDENIEYMRRTEKLWNALEIIFQRQRFDHRSAFNKFTFEIRRAAARKTVKPVSLRTMLNNTLKWAAIGLILLGTGSVITYMIYDKINPFTAKKYEVIVPAGSRSNILLADGTSVWLNAGSRLTYTSGFGSKERTVYLEGEGYFNVEKDHNKPFTVNTSQLEIVALGTSFNVKSYPEENIIQTTLISGSLLVNRSIYKTVERGMILEPNQQMTYYKDNSELLITMEMGELPDKGAEKPVSTEREKEPELPRIVLSRGVDPETFTSWKDNRLIFDNEPFEAIAVKLKRRFGAKIIIEDENIKTKKFKGQFDEITIEQALSALKFASPFEFHIRQDTIFITSP